MGKKHVIYSSELEDSTSKQTLYAYMEANDIHDESKVTQSDLLDFVAENNEMWHEDEMGNLNVDLDNKIVVIASIGTWRGRRMGYKVLGDNLNDILCMNYVGDNEVYCDAYNVCATDSHHDGTNYYTFRQIKDGVNIDRFLDKIYDGSVTKHDITRYTKSLRPIVKDIYGW